MKSFDILNTPLSGTNLIEASAGTGKTYTIEGLFVRLLVERHLSVEQILVVTYTKAATEELKDRIRKKLSMTREAFIQGSSDDLLIDILVKNHVDPAFAIQQIHEALINFDQAGIFTIHGFCQRILYENAFETGNLFDTELITDQRDLIQEITDDFWRKNFYHAPFELINYVTDKINGPEDLARLLGLLRASDINVIPRLARPALGNLKTFRKAFKRIKQAWWDSRQTVIQLLKSPALNATVYGSLKADARAPHMTTRDLKIFSLVQSMDRWVDSNSCGFPLFKSFEKFTAAHLARSVRKNKMPPDHEFFRISDEVFEAGAALEKEMAQYLLFLKTRLFDFANLQLVERKSRKNVRYFDDLLSRVKDALETNAGTMLADSIRQRYKAVLVDEFQDTDDLQYEIFKRLFSTQNTLLFVIGDPKQAIYGFRGADIFSYLKAARHVASKYTLTANWRSNPGLITAVNTIFSNVRAPFVFDEIPFEMGQPGNNRAARQEDSGSPFILWYLDSTKDIAENGIITKTDAVDLIAAAVAEEICRLVLPGPTCVAMGDIAVLVRTNQQARVIKKYLSTKEIPSVLHTTEYIFDSREAMEMEKILISISEPANVAYLKAALVMDLLGVKGEDIIAAEQDPLGWERRMADFREYGRQWNQHGFMGMFQRFLTRESVKKRLLSLPDGERRLTNLMHVAEILHQVSIEKNLGMNGLLKWLREQRNSSSRHLEEHQLRLESDANAVKVVTIHKSKGLEYPIVFCPFGWEGSTLNAKEIIFHDMDNQLQLTVDLGTKAHHRHLIHAQNECLAENLRLLYVALTRAKSKCYLVWGRIRTAETSAMAYLFHHGDKTAPNLNTDDIVGSLKERISAKTQYEFFADLKRLVAKSQGSIRMAPLPVTSESRYRAEDQRSEQLFCRKFAGAVDDSWKIASYSFLVSSRPADIDLPDDDLDRETIGSSLEAWSGYIDPHESYRYKDIFAFPKGARAGIFFHDLLEHIDFTQSLPKYMRELVLQKLQEYGFDQIWQETICTTIRNVLATRLDADHNELTLSAIPMSDRINEMEFYFPLNPVSPFTLQKIFKRKKNLEIPADYPERLEKLVFSPSTGFMKGYVDMLFQYQGKFYLVDWKSNQLGSSPDNYARDALQKVMVENLYILQYHLYTLAVYQYLRLRKPDFNYDSDFGGVFYIFIRGVDSDLRSTAGIFADLPNLNLICAMGKALIPEF